MAYCAEAVAIADRMVCAEIAGRAVAVRRRRPWRRRWAITSRRRFAPWAPGCTAGKSWRYTSWAVSAKIAGVDPIRLCLLSRIPERGPRWHGHLDRTATCCRRLYRLCAIVLDSPRQLCDSCRHPCCQIVVLAEISGDVVKRFPPSERLRLVVVALRQEHHIANPEPCEIARQSISFQSSN